MASGRLRLLRSSPLSQIAGDLEQHIESWIRSNSPQGLAALLDEVSLTLLRQAFAEVGGCEGTVWLLDQEEKNLVAVFNSGENADSLVGFQQPVGSGIISLVHSQQQTYCENDIRASAGHDDTLDRKMAKHTRAMIAVPFYFAFGLRGVVSCVQLEENHPTGSGFSSADVQVLVRVSRVVERLINEVLLSTALGLSDV